MNPSPKDADPGRMPVLAAVALGFAGVAVTLLAVQFLWLWDLVSWHKPVIWGLLFGGLLALFTARGLLEARPWAAILGSLLAPMLTLATTVWAVYALWNWSFALYMFFAPPITAVASLLCPFAIAPCIRSNRARAAFRGSSLLGAIDA
jgi:hypothetical protein